MVTETQIDNMMTIMDKCVVMLLSFVFVVLFFKSVQKFSYNGHCKRYSLLLKINVFFD